MKLLLVFAACLLVSQGLAADFFPPEIGAFQRLQSSQSLTDAFVDGPVVNTTYGAVQGTTDATTGARLFLGIPFAAPPVGPLRFKPPQPPSSWSGVRLAQALPNDCPQEDSIGLYGTQNEDCLYLNVFTPGNANASSNLPVMFWIYGGSFTSGSNAIFLYQGNFLAERHDVVVVTINYRLGALGFLVHDALSREDPNFPSSGNYGLKDQQAALNWVQTNIAAFGGNPKAVTVFGESAGGMSTCFHLIAPLSAGLFSQAIIESGPCLQGMKGPSALHYYNYTDMRQTVEGFIASVNCSSDDQAQEIECLRGLPVTTLVQAQGPLSWLPVVDNFTITADPLKLFAEGLSSPVNLLIGTNTNEGTLFTTNLTTMTMAELQSGIQAAFPDHVEQVFQAYPPSNYPSPGYCAAAINGDYFFMCPSRRLLRLQPPNTNNWQYQFNHIPSWVTCPGFWCSYVPRGVFHSSELYFVWGQVPPFSTFTPAEVALSASMMQFWASFATNGEPLPLPGALAWPQYTDEERAYMVFNDTNTVQFGYQDTLCNFWDSITKAA